MLSRFVIAFLPRSKCLLISWLQSPSAVILEPNKIKSVTVSIISPSICYEVMGLDAMIFVFLMLSHRWIESLLRTLPAMCPIPSSHCPRNTEHRSGNSLYNVPSLLCVFLYSLTVFPEITSQINDLEIPEQNYSVIRKEEKRKSMVDQSLTKSTTL